MKNIEKATVVIGVKPLPGTYSGRDASIDGIISQAAAEASLLYKLGLRSIMLQNVNDVPAYNTAPVHTVAYMTAICCAVKAAVGSDCKLGVSILRNDTPACIAVAEAARLDFVRAKVYVGAMMKMEPEYGNMNETLEMKLRLNSSAKIWADIHDRNGVPICAGDLLTDCGHAVRGKADSLIISGGTAEQTIELVKKVKNRFAATDVIVGGGANAENIAKMLEFADGVIIASSLKVDGKISNPIDEKRVKQFLCALEKA